MKSDTPRDLVGAPRPLPVPVQPLARVDGALIATVVDPAQKLESIVTELDQAGLENEAETGLRKRLAPHHQDSLAQQDRAELSEEGVLLGQVVRSIPARQAAQLLLFSTQLGLMGEALAGGTDIDAKRHPLMEALGLRGAHAADLEKSTAQLAQQIAYAVEKSGLFYESHLRQWREGRRSLASLLDEPQSDWPASANLGLGESVPTGADQLKASVMANQQLNLLMNPRLHLLMPGMQGESIDVMIERQDENPAGNPHDTDRQQLARLAVWRFTLKIQLKQLGRVHADFTLSPSDIGLVLSVESTQLQTFKSLVHEIRQTLQLSAVSILPLSDETP